MREEALGCGFFTAGLWCSSLGFACAVVGLLLVFVGLFYSSLFNTPNAVEYAAPFYKKTNIRLLTNNRKVTRFTRG
jgi:hypothetical protein